MEYDHKNFPSQANPPWSKVYILALKSLKKRAVRAGMTMISVVLSIAFLSYTWICNDVVAGMRDLNDQAINTMLMLSGIDLSITGTPPKTQWLIMLSLMVSSVGILNAMLTSVTERFKEIGTMKCIGSTNTFIVRLFVIEAGIQGAVGTSVGILAGLLIAFLQSLMSYGSVAVAALPILSALLSVLYAFLIGMGLTVLFALYPAWTAANMLPVEAMRVEE